MARILFVYINAKPGEQVDPLRAEFIKYVFSKQGQMDVNKAGFLPVMAPLAQQGLKLSGVTK